MQESVTYQALLEKGKQQGRREGMQAGEQALTLRLLERKLGKLPENIVDQIQSLSLTQLEQLADALLEFESIADLVQWLRP
jgi:predicted transposase YdaD